MRFRSLFVVAGFAAVVFGAPDIARASGPQAWSGPYVGLFAGYAWSRADASAPFDSNTGFFYNWTGSPYGFDADGALAGATAGYNWQSGAWVAGLEGEIGYLGLSGSAIDPNFQPGAVPVPDTVTRFESDVHAALYARVGASAGSALFYLKGGAALLNARASTVDPCANAPGCGTTALTMHGSKVMIGWSLGGGAEWALDPRWTVKAEYVFFDFGKIDTAGPSSIAGEFYRQSIDVHAHTVRFGVNYRFGAPAAPMVRK